MNDEHSLDNYYNKRAHIRPNPEIIGRNRKTQYTKNLNIILTHIEKMKN
ncbi:MAG: hypothetical protein FWH29_01630 [Methanobrevibacter sp.]|nr:hypothetical protein [Methanobrevibacter sp.]